MTKTNWTAGPWIRLFNDSDYWDMDIMTSDEDSLVAGVFGEGFDEINANAHLIAAAPELYEALDELLFKMCCPSAQEKALKVLAKARGES
jgi:hypothetical protein